MNPAAILSVVVKAQGVVATNKQIMGLNNNLKAANATGTTTTKRMAAVGASGKKASGGLLAAAKGMGAFVAAYAGLKGIEKSIHTTEELGKTTLTLARNFGVAADEAARWAAVSKSRGIDPKQLTMGFKTLSTQVRAASTGTEASIKIFRELGISQRDLAKSGDDLGAILGMVSDGIDKLPSGTNRAAIQSRLFGRSWQVLAPLIRDGSGALNENLKLADKYGATIGGKTLKSVQESIKAQREAKLASIGLQVTLGQTLIPIVDKVVKAFAETVLAFREGTGTAGKLRDMAGQLVDRLQPLGESIGVIVGWLKQHEQIAKILIGTLVGLSVAIWAINTALAANPVVLFGVALAALAVAIVTAYRESKTFRDVIATIGNVVTTAWTAVRDFASGVIASIKAVTAVVVGEVSQWDTFFSAVSKGFTLITDMAKLTFAVLKVIFQTGLLALKPIVAAAWKLITGIFDAQLTIIKGLVRGGLMALRGIITVIGGLLKGDFGQVWDGIKKIFSGGITALRGILEGAWKLLKAPVEAIGAGIKEAFSSSWDGIKSVFRSSINAVIGFLNVLIDAINLIPGVPDIKKISPLGGGGGGGANRPSQNNLGGTGHLARGGSWGMGGMVRSPTVIMGEEAPRHPEFVIPTNPAYRGRARGLLGQAAQAIGYAKGGIYSQGEIMDLWTGQGGASSRRLIASAIAMAESSGNANAVSANPAGGVNRGLYQIWSGNPGSTFDPAGNTRGAINLSHNGANWGLWETFVNGMYKKFLGTGRGAGGVGGLSTAADILGKFPKVSDAMGMFGGLGKYVLAKAGAYVKKQMTDLVTSSGNLGNKGVASGLALGVQQAIELATKMGFAYPSPGQLTSGGHTQGSLHFAGRAVDFGAAGHSGGQMMALWNALVQKFGLRMNELFYDPAGRYIDAHRWLTGAIGGHGDHIHVGFRKGGILGPMLGLAQGGQFPPGKKVYHQFWKWARSGRNRSGPITKGVGRGTSPAQWLGSLRGWFGVNSNGPIWPYDKAWQPKWNRGEKYARGGVLPFLGSYARGGFTSREGMAHLHANEAILPMKKGGKLGGHKNPFSKAMVSVGGGRFVTVEQYAQMIANGYDPSDTSRRLGPVTATTVADDGSQPNQELIDAMNRAAQAAEDLKKAEDRRIALDQEVLDRTKALQRTIDTQGPEMIAAVVQAVSVGIGGKVGIGFQSPSYAGGLATYKLR